MLSNEEIQDILADTASKFHEFCHIHNLTYSLAYGTLLGAVRHRGFIPWDNDMDLYMPRPDFEKLLELLKTVPIDKTVDYLHWSTHASFHYSIMRIYDTRTDISVPYLREYPQSGVWIDIFPVDGVDEKLVKNNGNTMKLKLLKKIQGADLYSPHADENIIKSLMRACLHAMFSNAGNSHMRAIDEAAKAIPFGSSRFCCDLVERPYGTILPTAIFDDLMQVDFSSPNRTYRFFIPKDSHTCLQAMYGNDYMIPPPPELRQTHEIYADWKTTSQKNA